MLSVALGAEGSYYLETAGTSGRAAAEQVAVAAADAGCPGAVVRLFQRGRGWVYVFRTRAGPRVEEARVCLDTVPWGEDAAPTLMSVRDGLVAPVADPIPSRPEPASEGVGEVDAEPSVPLTPPIPPGPADAGEETAIDMPGDAGLHTILSAGELLRRVASAHGGPGVSEAAASLAENLVFRFERTTPTGQRVSHVYASRGDDLYLEVHVLEGEGVTSRAGLVDGVPWGDPEPDEQLEPDYVRSQLARFSPARVLSVPARFLSGVPSDREFQQARVAEPVLLGSRPTHVLAFDGDREAAPMRLYADAETWRIMVVEAGSGTLTTRWEFSGYRELDQGRIHPTRISVFRAGQLIDLVEVTELDVAPALPGEWFEPRE